VIVRETFVTTNCRCTQAVGSTIGREIIEIAFLIGHAVAGE
jgi:hypothetical protein